LIELLAVIVILAIIAAIAIPAIGNIIDNSRVNAAKADAVNILNAANIYFTDEGAGQTTANRAALEPYVDNWGTFEGATEITITKGPPATLSGTATLSNNQTITFTNASIQVINNADVDPGGTISGT
ncbi:MAG: Tfp assembly type protein, partial [Lysinibacillus sp.]